ncbi:hypothetical protein ZWY2020_041456 [Hordeum vulgare]|nr:hypothetical protein ZWY2020_041456 [Hordeum vulgare]
MRPFYTMLLALAIVVLCSDVATKVVTANGGGAAATVTLMDCKVLLTIPGKCTPRSAWTTARVASAVPRSASALPTDAGARIALCRLGVVGTERRTG